MSWQQIVGTIFGGPAVGAMLQKTPKPSPYPAVPTANSAAVAAAANAQRIANGNLSGMQSTILTGGQGVTNDGTIQKMALLGGG